MFPESHRRTAQEKYIYLLHILTAHWRYVQVHLLVDQNNNANVSKEHDHDDKQTHRTVQRQRTTSFY